MPGVTNMENRRTTSARYANRNSSQGGSCGNITGSLMTRLECDICGRMFKDRLKLRDHIDSHTGTKSYICACGKSYRHNESLSRHKKACKT